eukprot:TRINITY_DN9573_c0_g1_i1.p1 TRINITY_DN9573_c0_g1~~TRINITY_DN9573_c0_g1_i1.p1  ORF type:complete len:292 (+),score=107.86 TRINITY_DN9573_c0_g1_i1:28-876(+)
MPSARRHGQPAPLTPRTASMLRALAAEEAAERNAVRSCHALAMLEAERERVDVMRVAVELQTLDLLRRNAAAQRERIRETAAPQTGPHDGMQALDRRRRFTAGMQDLSGVRRRAAAEAEAAASERRLLAAERDACQRQRRRLEILQKELIAQRCSPVAASSLAPAPPATAPPAGDPRHRSGAKPDAAPRAREAAAAGVRDGAAGMQGAAAESLAARVEVLQRMLVESQEQRAALWLRLSDAERRLCAAGVEDAAATPWSARNAAATPWSARNAAPCRAGPAA